MLVSDLGAVMICNNSGIQEYKEQFVTTPEFMPIQTFHSGNSDIVGHNPSMPSGEIYIDEVGQMTKA